MVAPPFGPDDRDWDITIVAAFDRADGSHLAAAAGRRDIMRKTSSVVIGVALAMLGVQRIPRLLIANFHLL